MKKYFWRGFLAGIMAYALGTLYIVYQRTHMEEFDLRKAHYLTLDKKELTYQDFIGKPLIINYWSLGCVPCIQEMPTMNRAYLKYQDSISFYFISDHDKEDLEKFNIENQYKIIHLNNMIPNYKEGVSGLPTTFFIDKNGRLVEKRVGSMDSLALENLIKRIRNEL